MRRAQQVIAPSRVSAERHRHLGGSGRSCAYVWGCAEGGRFVGACCHYVDRWVHLPLMWPSCLKTAIQQPRRPARHCTRKIQCETVRH